MEEDLGTSSAVSQGNLLRTHKDHAWIVFSSPSSEVQYAKSVAPKIGTS